MSRRSPHRTLQWFGFRHGLKGALIIGVLAGFMVFLQGVGYAESYTDEASRERFAQEMASVPSLGILYGSSDNLSAGVHGYIVYRVVAFMSLIIAIWGLMSAIKLLRGNEEDGRWEIVRAGRVTALSSTLHATLGFLHAFALSFGISTVCILLVAQLPDIALSPGTAFLISCALFAPALICVALGVFVSQLAVTRRRALFYGLIFVGLAYFIRSIGNTNPDFHDLLYYTPFGWNMLVSPVISPNGWWLGLSVLLAILLLGAGIALSRRDLGSSIIKESTKIKSRFWLLGSPWQLALRQNLWVYSLWGILSVSMGVIVAGVLDVATGATAGSSVLSQAVESLAGTAHDLRLAFLGAGIIFIVLVLLILATVLMGSIRNDEAKQYLDSILVQPQTRSMWLISRLCLALSVTLVISFITMALTYMAAPEDLPIEFAKFAALSISMLGSVIFLLGLGTLVYGILPRFAVIVMYLVITWSFIIDLVSSVVSLDEWLLRSSLFHYMTFNVGEWPDWQTFGWLSGLGAAMAIAGIYLFTQRDIVQE